MPGASANSTEKESPRGINLQPGIPSTSIPQTLSYDEVREILASDRK
jgi:hypothetical protein